MRNRKALSVCANKPLMGQEHPRSMSGRAKKGWRVTQPEIMLILEGGLSCSEQ